MGYLQTITILCVIAITVGAFVVIQKISLSNNEAVPAVTSSVAEDNAPVDTNIEEEAHPTTLKGKTVDLSDQGLREAPRSLFEKRDTEVLDLSGNMLTSLQAEIRQLGNLRSLDLSGNIMTNIPAEIGQLSKLEILDLKNNRLTGLPYELGNLGNLKTLDLRGNNYAEPDLDIIRRGLSSGVHILTD